MIRKIRKALLNYAPILSRAWLVYGFPSLYKTLEIQPTSAVIMITNRCNLRCIMCRQWRDRHAAELSVDDWKGIFPDLKKNGIRNIHFTGGEPLLRNDLTELVACASKTGFVVGMTTNGSLLKAGMLEALVKAGLRSVALSIDATEDAYESIRGVPGSFDQIKEAVLAISDMRKARHIDAYVNFTLMKNNAGELKRVKDLAGRWALPLHICLLDKNSSIFNLSDNGTELRASSDIDKESLNAVIDFLKYEKMKRPASLLTNFPAIDFIKEYFDHPRQEQIPCIVSQDRIFIDPSGDILGGCLSMGKFGNIKEGGLGMLKRGERYQRAKRNMFYKKCPGCSCGYVFNIRHFAPCIVKNMVSSLKYSLGNTDG